MKIHISLKLLIPALLLMFSVMLVTLPVSAHDGEVHEEEVVSQVELMEQVVALLQQLLVLLSQQANIPSAPATVPVPVNIIAEEHHGKVHIHLTETGKEEVKFFLEDVTISEHDAIIDAIVAKTGIERSIISAGMSFPTEHDDDHSNDALDGIHIMADGTVMLGNGTSLPDADVTEDGKIKLVDGTIVEPEFDLR